MGPLGPWDASVRPEPYRAFFGGGDGGVPRFGTTLQAMVGWEAKIQ